jgi:hypothetical protein
MLWLEGVALLLATRAMHRRDPTLARRVARVTVLAAIGAATFTLLRVVETAVESGDSAIAVAMSGRWSAAIPSLGASGSYFTMTAILAVGLGLSSTLRRAIGWIAAAAVLATAAWMTKSMAAILTLMAALMALAAWFLVKRWRRPDAVAAIVVIGAALSAVGLAVWANPAGIIRADAPNSLQFRTLLARGAVDMVREHPLFGVGIRQFRLRYPEFRPPELPDYIEDDPHNHLLGIAAELGLVGLAGFLWLMSEAVIPIVRLAGSRHADGLTVGMAVALLAFLATGLSHQPLNVAAPALAFWVVLGVASAPSRADRAVPWWRRGRALVALGLVVALVVSVPFRARSAIDRIDLTRVQYGFHDWEVDGAGTRFHWTSGHSTLFLPKTMSLINLPVSASMDGTPGGVTIRLLVDGEPAGQLRLTDEAWHDIRLVAPRGGRTTWRVDLLVSPTWVPAEIGRNPDDGRTLGVRVQEPMQREVR